MTEFFGAEPPSPQPLIESNLSPDDCFGVVNSTFVFSPVNGARAVTDRGTVVPLYQYQALITPSAAAQKRFDPERDMGAFLAALETIVLDRIKTPGSRLERAGAINSGCNCHGFVFTNGQIGIHDKDVVTILEEHRYEPVSRPAHGDLAVYRFEDTITHTGIVQHFAPGHEILVRSKWGPFGVFWHHPAAHGGELTYYHTPRWGHALTVLPAAA